MPEAIVQPVIGVVFSRFSMHERRLRQHGCGNACGRFVFGGVEGCSYALYGGVQ